MSNEPESSRAHLAGEIGSIMKQITLGSLSSEALNQVVTAITSGEFEPGQKISESELARRLGISRGPIREALHQLEGRLVSRIPRN